MPEAAINVRNISKKFSIRPEKHEEKHESFFKKLKKSFSFPVEEMWALKDISFEVNQGESVGIIGLNGAGKSTLLKILSDIIRPTSGSIEITGKLAAILEIGVGFNQELTGRQNISLYGKMLGFSKQDILSKTDEIIAFSGIHNFIDTPVKFYSSGMLMRLGFSVIASLDADIILLDEILAVGDVIFRNKCVNKIIDLKNKKKTIVIVGHDLNDISNYCDKIILLHNGELVATGAPVPTINLYQKILIEEKKGSIRNERNIYKKEKLNLLFSEYSYHLKTQAEIPEAEQISDLPFAPMFASVGQKDTGPLEKPLPPESEIQITIKAKYMGKKGDLAYVVRDIMNNKIFGHFVFGRNNPTLEENVIYSFHWTIPHHIFNEGIYKLGIILFDENYKPVYNLHEALIFEILSDGRSEKCYDLFTPINPLVRFDYQKELN